MYAKRLGNGPMASGDGADIAGPRRDPTGRTLVEVGDGVGVLALRVAAIAERIYYIEANPSSSYAFAGQLYAGKPKNVPYRFGAAEGFAGQIIGDVAPFCALLRGGEPARRLRAIRSGGD